ncbi:MAG: hypothetical protein M3Z25_20275 [Actinomycetota bacterium]|nr:hypothetical protein [Actinomycetota bacterium]
MDGVERASADVRTERRRSVSAHQDGKGEGAATLFVTTYGIFAVGETLFAPVLNPLTASLAPAGMVGTTLGLVAALQTGVSAVGPLLAGVALGAGHGTTFVVAHLVVSGLAVGAALRLRSVLRGRPRAVVVPGRPSLHIGVETGA